MGFLNQNLSKYFIKSSAKQWLFFVGIMLLSIGHLHGQSITVIDAFTQRPLEEVMVVNQNKKRYSSSDIRGKIDLEQFVASDLLTFQLMGYETLTLSLEEIKDRRNVIALFLDEKQLEEIANIKLPDLNTTKLESAMKIVEGTARNMGISIVD